VATQAPKLKTLNFKKLHDIETLMTEFFA